jgi:mono/diheme cytochrome c family protein
VDVRADAVAGARGARLALVSGASDSKSDTPFTTNSSPEQARRAVSSTKRCFFAFALALWCANATSADAPSVTPEQAKHGATLYAQHCAPCHGHQMKDPEGAFDLRKFPLEQHARFVTSVTKGKGVMPPWGGVLSPEDVQALWAYVNLGEKN